MVESLTIQHPRTLLQSVNPLSADPIKWLNTLKQFVGNLPMNCLNVFHDFVGLVLKGLHVNFEQIFACWVVPQHWQ